MQTPLKRFGLALSAGLALAAFAAIGAAHAQSTGSDAAPATHKPPVADGTYTLAPQNAPGSRLDATGGATTSGQTVQIWANGTGNPNQQWIVTYKGDGAYEIQPSYDTKLALGIPTDAAPGNGTHVQMLTDTGGKNERWTLAATADKTGYTLTPVSAPGYTLNVSGPSAANGTQLQIWQATGGANTIFAFAVAPPAK